MGDFFQVMSVEFFYVGNIFDAVKAGIIGLHAENFIVLFAGVYHLEQANRPYSENTPGKKRVASQNQRIGRVAVFGFGFRNESVVSG